MKKALATKTKRFIFILSTLIFLYLYFILFFNNLYNETKQVYNDYKINNLMLKESQDDTNITLIKNNIEQISNEIILMDPDEIKKSEANILYFIDKISSKIDLKIRKINLINIFYNDNHIIRNVNLNIEAKNSSVEKLINYIENSSSPIIIEQITIENISDNFQTNEFNTYIDMDLAFYFFHIPNN